MFLNQYASILNGPPRQAGFRLAGFAGAFDDAIARFWQEQDLAQKSIDLMNQSTDLSNQALAESNPVKRAAIRKQEFDIDAQVIDIAQQMNDLNVQDIMSLDPSAMSDEDKAKFVQDRKNATLASKNAIEESHKYLLAADTYMFTPTEQKQEGSAAEATLLAAGDKATQAIYTALSAGDPVRSDNSALSTTVDNQIATAAQKVLDHQVAQTIVTDPAAVSTNNVVTAAQTAVNVTSTTAAPVFSNPTVQTTAPVVVESTYVPVVVESTYVPVPKTIETTKPSFMPLVAIAGLAFLLGKI